MSLGCAGPKKELVLRGTLSTPPPGGSVEGNSTLKLEEFKLNDLIVIFSIWNIESILHPAHVPLFAATLPLTLSDSWSELWLLTDYSIAALCVTDQKATADTLCIHLLTSGVGDGILPWVASCARQHFRQHFLSGFLWNSKLLFLL